MKIQKIKTIIVVTLLLTLLCAMIAPAAANTRVYAEKKIIYTDYSQQPWDWYHVALVYPVSLQANINGHMGGVDQATLDQYAPEHRNLREWTRKSYGSDKLILLIPKRYVLNRWNFASEIYLEYLPGQA